MTIEGGGHWVDVAIDEHGRFEARLLPGKYIVYGPGRSDDGRGITFEAKDVEIPSGSTHTLDIDMD